MHDIIYNLNLLISAFQLVIAVIFSLIFYQEWKEQKRTENERYIPLALMFLYLMLSIGFILIINSNFFIDPSLFQFWVETKTYFYNMGLASIIILGFLIYIAERIIHKKTKHLILIYFLVIVAIFFGMMIFDIPFFPGFYLLIGIPLGLLIGLFFYKLVWKGSGKIRQKMIVATIGYTIFVIAIGLVIRLILLKITEFPLYLKSLALLASILVGWSFYTIPSFSEFDWNEKIRHLYILSPQGICLFQQPFKIKSIADEDLLGGSLMAINTLIQELIQTNKTLRVIDQEEAKILFEPGPNANCVIVVDEDLYIIRLKLKQLMKEFDLLFGAIMKEWNGEIQIFKPLQSIVNRIFEIENV